VGEPRNQKEEFQIFKVFSTFIRTISGKKNQKPLVLPGFWVYNLLIKLAGV